jgi:uncharacterized protein YbaR (Trm112 family)
MSAAFDARLLEVLVCPATRTKLRYDAEAQELISDKAAIAYPIRHGVPVMLIEEARPVHPPHAPHGEGDRAKQGGGVDGSASEGPARDG